MKLLHNRLPNFFSLIRGAKRKTKIIEDKHHREEMCKVKMLGNITNGDKDTYS